MRHHLRGVEDASISTGTTRPGGITRTALVLWAVACCLPLATVGLANLALGVYSYDSTPEPWEAPVYWTLTVVPLLALGTACWSAFTQRLFRSSVALLSLVSAGVIYYAIALLG